MLNYIATPTIDGRVHAGYAKSLACLNEGRLTVDFEVGNSLIADARNKLVERFLRSQYDQLVFIDSDISWYGVDFARLTQQREDLIAGCYQKKKDVLDFAVVFGPKMERNEKGLIEAERVGTGFMCISRRCILQMIKAYPETYLGRENFYALFDTKVEKQQLISEDYTFCDRWRAIGGKVMIDPEIHLGHHGTKLFDAKFSRHLPLSSH